MKNKITLVLIMIIVFISELKSQSFDEILKTIESNNQDIQAAQKLLESKIYEYKNMILPEGPEFSYGYFPDNSSNIGSKETFEISQSFQMPCFYRNQSSLSKLLTEQERISYQHFRQTVLAEAKKLLIESIYLTKMSYLLQTRLADAESLLQAYTKRLETGDVNLLEVNKSKLYLLHIQNQVKTVQTELNSIQKQLIYYNGGQELNFDLAEYPQILEINADEITIEKQNNDPELLYASKQIESSAKMVKVTRNLQLPKFSMGYAGETVADEKFRGVVIGLSVPLWSGNSAVKKAKFESQYLELSSLSMQTKIETETKAQIDKIQSLKKNLDNYSQTLSSVNNIELLKKSLELGEISSIEYFTEISYFYQIYDDYLISEKEYQLAVCEMLQFKL
ncbi:MAG: hypothetical protein A2W99_00610 [Bacteroidetes bacterium GWF2_33_16]|nr:MAG: hypothetical protein A2X00_03315 [Bacteroidetes bacterium GWE2_32_14]OFY08771.1 MAG: hypothetical protein A2W99_00610 [Bacteroidetes bacterium GWF2_33_16]